MDLNHQFLHKWDLGSFISTTTGTANPPVSVSPSATTGTLAAGQYSSSSFAADLQAAINLAGEGGFEISITYNTSNFLFTAIGNGPFEGNYNTTNTAFIFMDMSTLSTLATTFISQTAITNLGFPTHYIILINEFGNTKFDMCNTNYVAATYIIPCTANAGEYTQWEYWQQYDQCVELAPYQSFKNLTIMIYDENGKNLNFQNTNDFKFIIGCEYYK